MFAHNVNLRSKALIWPTWFTRCPALCTVDPILARQTNKSSWWIHQMSCMRISHYFQFSWQNLTIRDNRAQLHRICSNEVIGIDDTCRQARWFLYFRTTYVMNIFANMDQNKSSIKSFREACRWRVINNAWFTNHDKLWTVWNLW